MGVTLLIWDKHAYPLAASSFTLARNKHWTHLRTNTNVTADTVESIKFPLEDRIWHNYPGQTGSSLGTAISGTFDQPIRTGRVLDDGTTQRTQATYNSVGHVTDNMIDPVGRETHFTYAANGIDLQTIARLTTPPSNYTTTAAFSDYNSLHEPQTYVGRTGRPGDSPISQRDN